MQFIRVTGRSTPANPILAVQAALALVLSIVPVASPYQVAAAAESSTTAAAPPVPSSTSGATISLSGDTDTAGSAQPGEPQLGKVIIKPGQPIAIDMQAEDIQPTDDVELASRQAAAYPDSPEASFILAVALTRTSHVEEALKEVRHARHLAQAKGGAEYFDKMIAAYEKMLESCPDDNRVRYSLAWAYYMKAYLLTQSAKKQAPGVPSVATAPAALSQQAGKAKSVNASVANQVLSMIDPKLAQKLPAEGKVSSQSLPHIPGALEQAPPSVVPQVRTYYEAALKNLDDILARKPDDVWSRVYRAHLYAEYTGDLSGAMTIWKGCQQKYPQNPASYFFLGEGYLKQGNLKECFANISRAIALRALGN